MYTNMDLLFEVIVLNYFTVRDVAFLLFDDYTIYLTRFKVKCYKQ